MKNRRQRGRGVLFLSIGILSVIYMALFLSPRIALALDTLVGAHLRALLSRGLTGIPISVTEWLLLALPGLLLLFLPLACLAAQSASATRRLVAFLLIPATVATALYVLTFATGRHTPPVAERLSLPTEPPPTSGEMLAAATWLSSLSAELPEYPGDSAVQDALRAAYGAAGESYGFSPNTHVAVKATATPIFLRLGYFGLYAFPLGEITLAAECPHAIRTFTLAHEMAHASGFAREEEADLIALLVGVTSGDAYIAGAVAEGILGRFLDSLAVTAPAVWREVSAGLSPATREELDRAGDIYESGRATEALAPPTPDYGQTVLLTVALYRCISSRGDVDASIL